MPKRSEGARNERKGGLQGIDPDVSAWQAKAVRNEAALTGKQKYDRGRIRVRLDVPEAVAEGLEREADSRETSQTQLGAFLVAWGLYRLHSGDAELEAALGASLVWSKAINVKYDLVIPKEVLEIR